MTTLLWTLVALWVISIATNLYGLGAGKFPVIIHKDAAALQTAAKVAFLIWALILLLT
jgi:hypothetical protein